LLYIILTGIALAYIALGRFEEAVAVSKKALRQNQTYANSYRCLAAAFAQLGRHAEAKEAAARLLELDPAFHISEWIGRAKGQIHPLPLVAGLRLAGLPE
jgi:adenylate cyclase